MPETINVKPSARILKILGDIEFQDWQCLAELIDNAFDDFLNIKRSALVWDEGFRVSVTLPLQGTPHRKEKSSLRTTVGGCPLAH